MKKTHSIFNKYYFILPYYLATISLYRGHQGSFLGWIWLVIKPIIQVIIYVVIFPLIAKFEQENYSYFLITGILPWTFISSSIIECCNSLINRNEVLKRCIIDKTIFPLADLMKHFILFIISFIVMYILSLMHNTSYNFITFLLPIAILPCLIFTISVSVLMSFLTPYVRDLAEVVSIGFNILFFFTPIVYPMNSLPDKAKCWFSLNPIYWLIEPIKQVMFYGAIPSMKIIIVSTAISVMTALISFIIYRCLRKNVIFYL